MGLLFVGDFLPNGHVNCRELFSGSKPIGNMECVFASISPTRLKAYPVILDPDHISIVRDSGFAALNLANNHVYDAGEQAFDHMVDSLADAAPGIQFYGLKNRPFARLTVGELRCAVIGCLEPCRSRGPQIFPEEDVLSVVREIRDDFDKVFVTPHWGKEGEYAFHPSPQQRKLAKMWIDDGVDGVFGHHSHTMHGNEIMNNRPIFYSLGNFFFNHEEGKEYPLTRFGLAVECDANKTSLTWKYRFLRHGENNVEFVKGDGVSKLDSFFMRISKNLVDEDRPWTWYRWAKAVGPIYVAKSSRSWRLRFKRNSFLGVFFFWLAWNSLPKTLLMQLGSWMGDSQIIKESKRMDSELSNLFTW